MSCELVNESWKYCAFFSLPPAAIYSPAESSPKAGNAAIPVYPKPVSTAGNTDLGLKSGECVKDYISQVTADQFLDTVNMYMLT